ncbi:MAG: cytochrome c oxidase accessory protein CcoG [Betaproteobacteria bacterium]|nr:cytochrome c oxidase accessory protein CcoG [Betaproteobacteria bacterium]
MSDAPVLEERSLYEVHQKIYPRAVHGWFAAWRWALVVATQLVFYGGAWLTWNGRQAVLFDIVHRRFYIFGLVFWPQDVIYLTALLVLSALSLFLFTAVAGRLWCGYACPQTVYTEIFLWVERLVEGDRNAQMRLDESDLSFNKFLRKTVKHSLWIGIALWTGITFVGYVTPIRELLGEIRSLSLGPWEMFWVGFYGFATYGNAGWMREQVCKYLCPYARFQSAMFDRDTMIITYDAGRGEPRGKKKSAGAGDCVDCGICVQVCPTGIDIRKGLQYECIGCAACVDGCDQVMDKLARPRGLIRYSTTNAMEEGWTRREMLRRLLRPRVLVYSGILLGVTLLAGAALYARVPLKVDVIRDRAAIAREVEGGSIENIYRLQIMNTTERARAFTIEVSGLPTIRLAGESTAGIAAATSRVVPVKVRIDPAQAAPGTYPIVFTIRAIGDDAVAVHEKSVFIVR